MTLHYADDDVTVHAGDCLDVLRELPDCSVDAVCTDPPYSYAFMDRQWDAHPTPKHYQAWCEQWARECLRVLKPGGHLIAFGGTRTYHRLACAVEDAGFEVRDSVSWVYGSGFPKSLNIDKAAGDGACRCRMGESDRGTSEGLAPAERVGSADLPGVPDHLPSLTNEATRDSSAYMLPSVSGEVEQPAGEPRPLADERRSQEGRGRSVCERCGKPRLTGWGSALKPAHEPIVVARKPFSGTLVGNVLEHGTGALNIDGCRVEHASAEDLAVSLAKNPGRGDTVTSEVYGAGRPQQSVNIEGRWPTNVVLTHSPDCELLGQVSVATDTHYPAARGRGGISVGGHGGQDGLTERTPATERIDRWACVEGCPVAELDAQSGAVGAFAPVRGSEPSSPTAGVYGDRTRVPGAFHGDAGGASRFFPTFRYEAKAGTSERPRDGEVSHPTVKPLELMRWLVRLVVPRGATVLDLFAGSGTTGEACIVEGMKAVLIEREPSYLPLIVARVSKPIETTLGFDVG